MSVFFLITNSSPTPPPLQELWTNEMRMRLEAQHRAATQTHVAYCIPIAAARAFARFVSTALTYCPRFLRPQGHGHSHGDEAHAAHEQHQPTRVVWPNAAAAAAAAAGGNGATDATGSASSASSSDAYGSGRGDMDAVELSSGDGGSGGAETDSLLSSAHKRE
jgi:hypothetical protein